MASVPDTAIGAPVALEDRVQVDSLSLVVSSWQCGGKELGSPSVATALGRFCIMQFSVRNEGNNVAGFVPASLVVIDEASRRYTSDATVSRSYSAQLSPSPTQASAPSTPTAPIPPFRQLNPGIELTGVLVFDIPETISPIFAVLGSPRAFPGVQVRLSS